MRIAMWSGPRNLSTALMYSFAARPDFAVWDEPFYAPYLAATGLPHPMADQIIAVHETDSNKVVSRCLGAIPDGKEHFYMKHMPHHMIEGMPLDWAAHCVNIHLIRHPTRVVASYGAKREVVTVEDIGFAQQTDLYDKIGGLVIDSADIRANPEGMLRKLCAAINLPFDTAMLHWPAGGHKDDGVWAAHWYGAIHASTGFAGSEGEMPMLEPDFQGLVDQSLPHYKRLAALKL
jgi:hypothetical protein